MSGLAYRQDSTGATAACVDHVRLRIDTSRAPRRQFTPDGRLMHVDYYATMGFGDVVQQYDDGAEFRPKGEVQDPEAMASFVGLVFSDEHPDDGVDVNNATTVNRGHILSTCADGDDMAGWVRVVDGRTIDRIDGGKDGLSCGYYLRTDNTPGTHNGVPYQRIQRRIRGQHLSLTGAPRGERGDDYPRIHFDSKDAPQVRVQKDSIMTKIKIKLLDGSEVEIEVPDNVAAAITDLQAKAGQAPVPAPGSAAPPSGPPAGSDDSKRNADAKNPAAAPAPAAGNEPLTKADLTAALAEHDRRNDARRAEEQVRVQKDAAAYGAFRADAEAVLRLDGKSFTFTGDLTGDRIGVAEVLLGDKDTDVVEAKAKLASRNDSQLAEVRAGAAGLYKAAALAARGRRDKTGEQLGGLVPRADSTADLDATIAAATRGFRPPTASQPAT